MSLLLTPTAIEGAGARGLARGVYEEIVTQEGAYIGRAIVAGEIESISKAGYNPVNNKQIDAQRSDRTLKIQKFILPKNI